MANLIHSALDIHINIHHNASNCFIWEEGMSFDFASNDVLLGIDEICQKLSISRSTFERLRRPNEKNIMLISSNPLSTASDDFSGLHPFPKPTIVLGRSPRWSSTILNEWLQKNSK